MRPEISLVICTRNRASQLERTLESCLQLTFTGTWELVLVNNGSTDETESVIQAFIDRFSIQVTYCIEPKAGISSARNHGIARSEGNIVAFTDDDCYPNPDYLDTIKRCLSNSSWGFCGGRVLLHDPTDLPITIQESREPKRFTQSDLFRSGQILGANMAARRDMLLMHRGFDEHLGAGSRFCSGEETDLFRRLLRSGVRGFYDPNIIVHHHHLRKEEEHRRRLIKNYSWGRGAGMAKQILLSDNRKPLFKYWYWQLRVSPGYQVRREIISAIYYTSLKWFSVKRCRRHNADCLLAVDD